MTNLSVEGAEVRHGGVIPFHLKERPDCPWCRERALLSRVKQLTQAASELHAEVEMAESMGICLPDRVPSLKLAEVLARQALSTSPGESP